MPTRFATSARLSSGLCVGSFLNVVIHRLPKMLERGWQAQCAELRGETAPEPPRYNLVVPRSALPRVRARRSPRCENIPVVSWLALRRQVRGVQGADLGALSGRRDPRRRCSPPARSGASASTPQGVAACVLLWTLLALTFIDFDTQLLPDDITLPLLWAGLVVNLWGVFAPLRDAVIGAVAGYLSLWTIYWLFKLIRGKEGMGYGDFKLLGGARRLARLADAAADRAAVVGRRRGRSASRSIVFKGRDHNVPLAFGPYLAIAGAHRAVLRPGARQTHLSVTPSSSASPAASAAASRRWPTRSRRAASTSPTPIASRMR